MPADTTADQWVDNGMRSQPIFFSHVDSAGIVFYPRYFELLADSFSEWFPSQFPFRLDLEFNIPIRLGEMLELNSRAGASCLSVVGKSGSQVCFTADLELLQELHLNSWQSADVIFSRNMSVPQWMAGPHSFLHLSRYFELVSSSIEIWFADVLNYSFKELHLQDGKSVPTVKLEAEFIGLPKLGDKFSMQLRVLHASHRSIRLQTQLVQEGNLLAQTTQVLVFASNSDGDLHSAVLPKELLRRIISQINDFKPQ